MTDRIPRADRPNPGSEKAAQMGCTCPVRANNHGISAPYPPDSWIVDWDCPIHGIKDAIEALKEAEDML